MLTGALTAVLIPDPHINVAPAVAVIGAAVVALFAKGFGARQLSSVSWPLLVATACVTAATVFCTTNRFSLADGLGIAASATLLTTWCFLLWVTRRRDKGGSSRAVGAGHEH